MTRATGTGGAGISPTTGRMASGPAALAAGGMFALASAMGVGRFVYTPILPAMLEQLHLTQAQAGLIASANFVGYLAGALVAALPGLPGSRVRWLTGSALVVVASMLGMAWATGLAVFMLLRFAAGAGSAFVLILASGLVLGGLAKLRAPGFAAMHFAGVGLGIAGSAVLVGAMTAAGLDWRAQWVGAGIVAAIALLPAALSMRDRETGAAVAAGGAASLPGFTSFALAYGLAGFGYSISATFLVAMVRAGHGGAWLETAAWLSVGLAAVPSVWVWGRVGQRFGVRQAMATASVLLAVGNAVCVLRPDGPGLIASALLLGGTFMGITALGFAGTQPLAPEHRRRAGALITAAFGVGQIVGPAMAGVLADRTGSFLASTVAAAVGLVAGAVLLVAFDPGPHSASSHPA